MRRALLLISIAACSDSSTTGMIDAPGQPADAYDTARCLIQGHYGDLGTKTGTTSLGPTTLSIELDAGPPRDTFSLRLVAGKGVFPGALANGSYTLAGVEIGDFNSCGLCVSIVADIVTGQGPSKFYFATGGMVTLTGTQPPAGTLANVSLEEVTASGAPISGGCTASIGAMTFSM